MVAEFMGNRGEPTTIILLNGHSLKLLTKFVPLGP